MYFDEDLFPEIPDTWTYATIKTLYDGGLIVDFADGNHGGEYPRAVEFGTSGAIFITAAQIAHGTVDFASAPRLNWDKAGRRRKGWAEAGDVLLTHNATVGRVALVPLNVERFLLGTSATFYRTNAIGLSAAYLYAVMLSPVWQGQLRSIMAQTTRNQVSLQKQAFFRVPVAPLQEQVEIATRALSALGRVRLLEEVLLSNGKTLVELDSAILSKAFRGELVPQDPSEWTEVSEVRRVSDRASEVPKSVPRGKKNSRREKVIGP